MRLASVRVQGHDLIALGAADGSLFSLESLVAALAIQARFAVPATMTALIEQWGELQGRLVELPRRAGPSVPALDPNTVEWLPPVPRPGKILGVAMNNSASNARKVSAPDHPMFFLKPASCLIGHGQDIEVRSYYGGLHPEPELAVVIGRRSRDLDPSAAIEAVFGYSIMNDITGNTMRSQDRVHYFALYASSANPAELERREQHLSYAARYKGTDGFGPMGPWLVTRDEIPDPSRLEVTCRVCGEIVAEDSTRHLNYSVAETLAFISRFQTLEIGDVVSMGTAFREKPGVHRSIHTADMQRVNGPIEVSISGLGTLCNGIRRVELPLGRWRLPALL